MKRERGRRKEGKGKTNPCRGEQRERGRLRPLSHRQTAINKSIGNCGWLENGWGWEDGKERDLNQSSSKMDGARRGRQERRRRKGGFNRGGGVEKDAGTREECVEEKVVI